MQRRLKRQACNKRAKNSILVLFAISFLTIILSSSICSILTNDLSDTSAINSIVNDNSDYGQPDAAYVPINRYGYSPLGNVTILDITELGEPGVVFYSDFGLSVFYEYTEFEFLGVEKIATESTIDRNDLIGYLTIHLNESAQVDYLYNYTEQEFGFKPELFGGVLINVTVNGTSVFDDVEEKNDGYFYNYSSYYDANENGTLLMGYEYEYNLTIGTWDLVQYDMTLAGEDEIYLDEDSNTFDAYYNYTISPGLSGINMTADYLINFPDADYLTVNDANIFTGDISAPSATEFEDYTKYSNNSIMFSTNSNATQYSYNFETEFTIDFVNNHGPNKWSRDALVSGLNVREREYEVSITAGPDTIPVSFYKFNDTTFVYDDDFSFSSELERPVTFSNMTATDLNAIGITFDLDSADYYLVKGETDLLKIRYTTEYELNVIIMDSAQIPISDIELKFFYQNVSYGNVMSSTGSSLIADKVTNNQGQVILRNVPYGNYTVAVYQNGKFVENVTATTTSSVNVLYTSLAHFPTWILIYGGISFVLIIAGLYIYKKNE